MLAVKQLLGKDVDGSVSIPGSPWSKKQCYELGQEVMDEYGNEYVYVKTASAVSFTLYDALGLFPAGAVSITTALAVDSAIPIGIAIVACTAVTSTVQYGWVLVKTGVQHVTTIRVGALAAANAGLLTSTVAGVLDDTTAGLDIWGIGIGDTQGSVDGANATATLNRPFIQGRFA
jgi:hypothetical protein